MCKSKLTFVFTVVVAAAFLVGCVKNYKIIHDLEAPLQDMASCTIGAVTDELPLDFEEDKKPPLEDIEKFKRYLSEEIMKTGILSMSETGDSAARYEVRGGILEYKKGSGTLRVLLGAFAGNAYVAVNLKLLDRTDQLVVFSGSFKGAVTHYAESGDAMFRQVARDFAKALSKRAKKLRKK
ncbi:MAG: DUF4410 domain-containing protein [candidate division Zixibacteria bacterium]|nr:DUF4410 domain-containing protein [candidate division Zixibacteria bacterium]